MKRGAYIVLDGIDGAGKTDVLQTLRLHYPSVSESEYGKDADILVDYTREPGGTPLGEKIRSLLLDKDNTMEAETEFFLFLAQRIEVRKRIDEFLSKGVSIISDRSDSSTYAFQIHGRRKRDLMVPFWNLQEFLNPKPDLYIILDLPAEVAQDRLKKRSDVVGVYDRIDQEGIDFHQRVRDGFISFRGTSRIPCVFVDATRAPGAVAIDVVVEVAQFFRSHFQL